MPTFKQELSQRAKRKRDRHLERIEKHMERVAPDRRFNMEEVDYGVYDIAVDGVYLQWQHGCLRLFKKCSACGEFARLPENISSVDQLAVCWAESHKCRTCTGEETPEAALLDALNHLIEIAVDRMDR